MAEEFELKLRLPNEISQGDIIEVKIKISHPSTTGLGLSLDAENPYERFFRLEPAQFLRQIEIFYDEELISFFEMNSSTSSDPLLAFKLRADKAAPLRVVATNHAREIAEVTETVRFG